MHVDFTPIALPFFLHRARRTDKWGDEGHDIQLQQLHRLLSTAAHTDIGSRHDFDDLLHSGSDDAMYRGYAERVMPASYEDIRDDVMRMVMGEKDVLWRGTCRNFAQSSGTSGGKSKYIPITQDSLNINHYAGASDSVAHYLRTNRHSRLFSGKAVILGGSFANQIDHLPAGVRVGDLSATLINRINPLVNLFRTPNKEIALMGDWQEKLPLMADVIANQYVTNLSGVPSWMLVVLEKMMADRGVQSLAEVWPGLEVFFHGGISFEPYREQFRRITAPEMQFRETYNASEGFFAVQNDPADPAMLMIIDAGIFFEFEPIRTADGKGKLLPPWEVEVGKTYELIISAPNGLWRYRIGDTVEVTSVSPLKIRIAGRTKTFINAFGEELMENNAETAMARVCVATGAQIKNYTAGPVYADDGKRGRHQWIVEFSRRPDSLEHFAKLLDEELQKINSDYEAKRAHTIFLDPAEVIEAPEGLFDCWLRTFGNGRLGGQRKVPRLSNDRRILDQLLQL